jgi:hypothetical protein
LSASQNNRKKPDGVHVALADPQGRWSNAAGDWDIPVARHGQSLENRLRPQGQDFPLHLKKSSLELPYE